MPDSPAANPKSHRLPPNVPPVIGAWFPEESEVSDPEGYRDYLDAIARHSHYDLLTTTMRIRSRQMVDADVHDWFKRAAAYARERGVGLALEVDPRHSLRAYCERHPDQLLDRIWLVEIASPPPETGELEVAYAPSHGDAICDPQATTMTLERAWAATEFGGDGRLDVESIEDVTSLCMVISTEPRRVMFQPPAHDVLAGRRLIVATRIHFNYPDPFGSAVLEFEDQTIDQYSDCELTGLMKDEWGYPAVHDGNPGKNGFWFSAGLARAWRERTGSNDFVRDCLLMWRGETGREARRQALINHLNDLSRQRHSEIEDHFYRRVKEAFGPDAFVGTHDTVFPYPDCREFERNGLNWWTATRDYSQSDEITPYACRTSMAKKFGGPVWYNQWYSPDPVTYEKNLWSYALAGGRTNYHILYPAPGPFRECGKALLRSPVIRADCRVRLLNFVSPAPLDCPVLVVFGQRCAMNWAGPDYDNVGTELADAFWSAGYYADLVPSSEIADSALGIAKDGRIRYGLQRYEAAVLFNPQYEGPETAELFRRADGGPTRLGRVGVWTLDAEAQPFDGTGALPESMRCFDDVESCAEEIIAELRRRGVEPQTPATETFPKWAGIGRETKALPPAGHSRLTDGTVILVAGENEPAGDPIRETLDIGGHALRIKAVGIAAVRLDHAGALEAVAAGGLSLLETPGFRLSLPEPVDLALWRREDRSWTGVVQDWSGPVPAELLTVTEDWLRLGVPVVAKMD